ncbi:unnamed protein product [Paramecium sonneborni]|uniref:Transmembrane protein n=1 Tax=Paramecium sonneborni TaxID=65129 RepID=A0A8S1RS85_9CILI|nr:unnamed protein product [Paramecium sonneborni]
MKYQIDINIQLILLFINIIQFCYYFKSLYKYSNNIYFLLELLIGRQAFQKLLKNFQIKDFHQYGLNCDTEDRGRLSNLLDNSYNKIDLTDKEIDQLFYLIELQVNKCYFIIGIHCWIIKQQNRL